MTYLFVNVFKLRIAVRMLIPFPRFAVRLQTVTGFLKHPRHGPIRDGMVLSRQLLSQFCGTLARPAQRRFRMPTGGWIDQLFQRCEQLWILFCQPLTSGATATNLILDQLVWMRRPVGQFPHPRLDRIPCQTGRLRDRCHAAPAQRGGLRSGPLSAHAFVHHGRERDIFLTNPFDRFWIMHTGTIV